MLGKNQVSGEGDALVTEMRGVSAVLTECSLLGDAEIAARSSHQGALGQLHGGGLLVLSLLLYIYDSQVIKSEKLAFHKLCWFCISVVGCLCVLVEHILVKRLCFIRFAIPNAAAELDLSQLCS